MINSLSKAELGVSAFISVVVIIGLFKIIDTLLKRKGGSNLTQNEVNDLIFKSDLKKVVESISNTLNKLTEKGDERAYTLDKIHENSKESLSIHNANHKRIGKMDANLELLNKLYAK